MNGNKGRWDGKHVYKYMSIIIVMLNRIRVIIVIANNSKENKNIYVKDSVDEEQEH